MKVNPKAPSEVLSPQVKWDYQGFLYYFYIILYLIYFFFFAVDFNELIEQRRRERRDRMRHRFLDLKSTQIRHAPSGAPYTLTVLRPPSDDIIPEEEDEPSDPNSPRPSNKSEKQD